MINIVRSSGGRIEVTLCQKCGCRENSFTMCRMAASSDSPPDYDRLLRISSRTVGSTMIISVAGDVDTLTAGKLADAFVDALQQTDGPVIVDLTRVAFLGSHGLAILHKAANHSHELHRTTLLVADCANPVHRSLMVVGLDRILPLHATVPAALRALEWAS